MIEVERIETVIVGAGFSGISAARELLVSGRQDFLLLEQANAVGGVWRDNVYPNAACDVQAHLYSLSFAQNPDWSNNFAHQREIWDYQNRVVDELGIRHLIRFGTRLDSAVWNASCSEWNLVLTGGRRIDTRFLILATGTLNQPLVPDLPGSDRYRGVIVHTAEWDTTLSMRGKRVAVIGAGASAIQVVPAAVDEADAVFVSVRTAPYVMPKPEERYTASEKQFFRDHPEELLRRRRELYDYWNYSTHAQAVMDEEFLSTAEATWRTHMEAAVSDPTLRSILTPDYRFGCRRPVVSNDFYPALADPKTTVSASGVVGFTESGIRTADGEEWDADIVVLATGFRATEMFENLELVGADGRSLVETWRDGPRAFQGTLVGGFPNLFLITGPNTQASGSIIGVIEAQTAYVARLLNLTDQTHAASITVSDAAQLEFDDALNRMMSRSVWEVGGCESWYKIGGTGRVAVKWPGNLAEFERMLAEIRIEDYLFDGETALAQA
ncbi:NAD(P)/FAD-dependent oxidoreductase [Microbacterium schleiferi]|uniref:flavin-containing monooxygenase n=1 Tax=Microbacterium schleiferi TaxID=69362 RepID=UPI00311E79D7